MLDLIKQNNPSCKYDIREVGCFFRSSVAIAELHTGHVLNADEINYLWAEGSQKGFIVKRELVKGGAPIINLAFDYLHKKHGTKAYKAFEVGTRRNGVPKYYGGVSEEKKQAQYFIKKRINPPTMYYKNHFVLVNKDGSLLWDPYTPDTEDYKEDYTILFYVKEA